MLSAHTHIYQVLSEAPMLDENSNLTKDNLQADSGRLSKSWTNLKGLPDSKLPRYRPGEVVSAKLQGKRHAPQNHLYKEQIINQLKLIILLGFQTIGQHP